jgi:DUF4097 and DUF4098 domain-containing protein YvlB
MMKRILLSLALAGLAVAQEGTDKLKVAFRDPSRPGTLKIHLVQGGITVKGYNGQEVLIETTPRRRGEDDDDRPKGDAAGLRRIYAPSSNITVEEENNVMRIDVQPHGRSTDVTVQVPMKTSLNLHATNGGNIVVENVQGDIETNNTNGNVTLNNVAGSVVAHALNGNLMATIREVAADKPISFSSLNGKIDVTLPASLKANLNLQSARGEIYSDFDVVLSPTAPEVKETKREEGRGRYRVSTSKGMIGKVNGGGQDVTFKNMNGSIYIRKGK